MHPMLTYPFNPSEILKKRKKIKRELTEQYTYNIKKKIAVLGGSTTHDITEILELFLLNYGICPEFYESEFGRYFEDAMFGSELQNFSPDIIFIHTSARNIEKFPEPQMNENEITVILNEQYNKFCVMWDTLRAKFGCPIIQNNFELPYYRTLGNRDAYDIHGKTNFIAQLNMKFYSYAQNHSSFFINDIQDLSADFGLQKWSDPLYWHMYKYCMCLEAIPYFAFNLSNIIKSVYGKNKKAAVLDLDNTLWGGVIGDDGQEEIEIGHETSVGQVYSEFQSYLKEIKSWGVMLCINSKNDIENALLGLNHPEGTLRPEDFVIIKANWENKDKNISEIASELNILPESIVFIDDNPAERSIVQSNIPEVAAPNIDRPENYIVTIDRSGFFEASELSAEDLKRNDMYKANAERLKLQKSFENYRDYLLSLEMTAEIKPFMPVYLSRIAQLTNKSNQFNLTTRRFTEAEIADMAKNDEYICRCGKLTDKFGDNGIVTTVIGRKKADQLDLILWLMSCRVLKRGMEYAMMDEIAAASAKDGIKYLHGFYYKTQKNNMVKNFYSDMGFTKICEKDENTEWILNLTNYKNKNSTIKIVSE